MKTETLYLLESLTFDSALTIAQVLKTVEGVTKIAIETSNSSVSVDFDDDLASVQVLRTVMRRAGFKVQMPSHGEEGMCCGSCG